MSTHQFQLGHVHIKVRDVKRAVGFYYTFLGFELRETVGESYAFLAYGSKHHDLAMHKVPEHAPTPGLKDIGLYHLAVEVPSLADLKNIYCRLREAGVQVRPVDHGISKVLYFDDPDGNGVEVYVDTREANQRFQWGGESTPLDIESIT